MESLLFHNTKNSKSRFSFSKGINELKCGFQKFCRFLFHLTQWSNLNGHLFLSLFILKNGSFP